MSAGCRGGSCTVFSEGVTMASAEQFPWKGIGLPDLAPESGDVQLVAMVDAAQVSNFSMLKWPWLRHAVLVEPLAEDRFNATPHLFELPDTQDIGRLAAKLEAQSQSHGALSVFVARRPISTLAAAIRRRLDAVLPDGLDCMNRFFDGRVAPHVVAALTADQRRSFCAFASQWWVVGPDLRWLSLETSEAEDGDPFEPPLRLNELQQAKIIDACYPYALIEHFERTDEELLHRIPIERRYSVLANALQAAERYGLSDGPDAMLFCTLTMTRGERFFERADWQSALSRVQRGEIKLRDAMKAIP